MVHSRNRFHDQSGAIGRRYRRMDEVGTPWCITVDDDSREDGCATVRHSDSLEQERVPMANLKAWLAERQLA